MTLKYTIIVLTFLMFLCGLFILYITLYALGPGFYTVSLTLGTLIAFITLLINGKVGSIIAFVVSIGWLLRYFEHASYLILYDNESSGRWLLIAIPLILSFTLFGITFKAIQKGKENRFTLSLIVIAFPIFLSIGLLSFIRKSHVCEINCWYYIDKSKDDFKILFAISPDHKFEAISNSKDAKRIVLEEGMTYELTDGYYCPETKVKVITRFKEIIAVKVIGFRNSGSLLKVGE